MKWYDRYPWLAYRFRLLPKFAYCRNFHQSLPAGRHWHWPRHSPAGFRTANRTAASSSGRVPPASPTTSSAARKSAARSPLLPDVPSVADTYKGFDIPTWSGIFAPAGTPRDIIAKVNGDLNKVLQRADVKERFANQGSESTPGTPEALAEHVRKETVMYAAVIKAAKIAAE